jgi:hypothetical protein
VRHAVQERRPNITLVPTYIASNSKIPGYLRATLLCKLNPIPIVVQKAPSLYAELHNIPPIWVIFKYATNSCIVVALFGYHNINRLAI